MYLLILLLGSVAVLLTVNSFLHHKERKVKKMRTPNSLEDFIEFFSRKGIPQHILVNVYRYFQDWQGEKDFPVRPIDDLYKVYGICDDDIDDTIDDLAESCGCKIPDAEDVKDMPHIRTVEDVTYVLFRLYKLK
jgi:hypothetical protein